MVSESKKKRKERKEKKRNEQRKRLLLQGIVEIGEIAYSEEVERKKLLIEQSNSLIVVITLMITFLSLIMDTVISNNTTLDLTILYFMFVLVVLILLSCLVCAILVQWRRKYTQFQNAFIFFDHVKKNFTKYLEESAFLEEKMKGFGDACLSIKSNNDKRANLIKASHILVFISIGLSVITSIFYFLIL